MKTNVQHHDFIGSAAAATSENTHLQSLLEKKGVDTDRYEAVGAGFRSGHEDPFSGFIVCKDNQRSTEEREHLIRVYFKDGITKEEFFSLFKQFEVLLIPRDGGYGITEVNGELVISKKDEEA